jgi:hypothetical protein
MIERRRRRRRRRRRKRRRRKGGREKVSFLDDFFPIIFQVKRCTCEPRDGNRVRGPWQGPAGHCIQTIHIKCQIPPSEPLLFIVRYQEKK